MNLIINGYEYKGLSLTDYEIKLETLDGDATGRTKANGWPMIRDPQGTIINLSVEFGGEGDLNNSTNPDFNKLWQTCMSMGQTDFVTVTFVEPTGNVISQEMYLVASGLKAKRISRDGVVFNHALKINFIARKGV